jgi:hypothetical protein
MRPLQPMRVDWVATPPPGAYQHRQPRLHKPRYQGPPRYPVPPRWGFPLLAWRWPTSVMGDASAPTVSVDQVRTRARSAANALGLAAVTSIWAAGSEIWRYVLLMLSRFGALSPTTVGLSDAMVVSSSVIAWVASALAVVLTVLWLRRAREAAADAVGYAPSRSDLQVLIGLVVPGMNLVVPGSVAAELEHAALREPADRRPSPSRLVRVWWGLWAATAVFVVFTIAWSFRSSVQALADGVLLHAGADLLAASVAITTAMLVRRITTLLLPVDPAAVRFMRVIGVKDAPAPELRAHRYAGSPR